MTGPVSIVMWEDRGRVAIRPEWVRLGGTRIATVTAVRFRGSFTDLTLATTLGDVAARVPGPPSHHPGESVTWEAERVWTLVGLIPGEVRGPEGLDLLRDLIHYQHAGHVEVPGVTH